MDRYEVRRNGELSLTWSTLRGAVDHARRLQMVDPSALITIADLELEELILGWWLLSDEALAAR